MDNSLCNYAENNYTENSMKIGRQKAKKYKIKFLINQRIIKVFSFLHEIFISFGSNHFEYFMNCLCLLSNASEILFSLIGGFFYLEIGILGIWRGLSLDACVDIAVRRSSEKLGFSIKFRVGERPHNT
jgi:hypothetical protein